MLVPLWLFRADLSQEMQQVRALMLKYTTKLSESVVTEWIMTRQKTTQNFTSISYESCIEKLAYKCTLAGITLHTIEESFAS